MLNFTSGALVRAVMVTVLFSATVLSATVGGRTMNIGPDRVAIKGYDTVSYHTVGRAEKGRAEFAHTWSDAVWHFRSAAHRDLFAADPARYAPQFGGICSMGLASGKKVIADPEAWTIVDGKLYLNFNKAARERFRENAAENVPKAERNWETVRSQD